MTKCGIKWTVWGASPSNAIWDGRVAGKLTFELSHGKRWYLHRLRHVVPRSADANRLATYYTFDTRAEAEAAACKILQRLRRARKTGRFHPQAILRGARR